MCPLMQSRRSGRKAAHQLGLDAPAAYAFGLSWLDGCPHEIRGFWMPREMNHQVKPGDGDGNQTAAARASSSHGASPGCVDTRGFTPATSRTPGSSACPDGTTRQVVFTQATC